MQIWMPLGQSGSRESLCFLQWIHKISIVLIFCFIYCSSVLIQNAFHFCYYSKYNIMYRYIYTPIKNIACMVFVFWFICLTSCKWNSNCVVFWLKYSLKSSKSLHLSLFPSYSPIIYPLEQELCQESGPSVAKSSAGATLSSFSVLPHPPWVMF